MDRVRLRAQLNSEEGRIPYAYQDSLGYWTIGVGHLIDKKRGGRLDDAVIDLQLDLDVDRAERIAAQYGWYASLNAPRQNVIVDIIFNMGKAHFDEFHNAQNWIERGDFEHGADELANSLWAKQTGSRAVKLVLQLRSGVFV